MRTELRKLKSGKMKLVRICKNGTIWGQNKSYDKPGYRRKMSKILSGSNNPNWRGGKIPRKGKYKTRKDYLHSKENLEKLKKIGQRNKKGGNNPMHGKQHSKKTKKIMSQKKKIIFIGKGNPNWQGGISFEPYTSDFNIELKEKIRKRDAFICQCCGRQQKILSRRLHVHHIDYDKTNNKPENLISLCKQCHIKTNYNRQKWINTLKNKQGGFRRGRI